jgi:peptidase S51-like protein
VNADDLVDPHAATASKDPAATPANVNVRRARVRTGKTTLPIPTEISKSRLRERCKPIAESDALCIPTALYGHPMAGPRQAWWFISGQEPRSPMVGLGWKSLGVLELTALPSLGEERWVPMVRETDVLLVDGGDAAYLCHWMRASGLADLLASLGQTVWVGVSAGSMVMTPRIGADFVTWQPQVASEQEGRERRLDARFA